MAIIRLKIVKKTINQTNVKQTYTSLGIMQSKRVEMIDGIIVELEENRDEPPIVKN